MHRVAQEIEVYYDTHTSAKLRGFIEGNSRVERVWQTIEEWAPSIPRRVLEIGCGIGDICWRVGRRWANAEVVGLDISPRSLAIAEKLFGSSRLSFIQGPLVKGRVDGKFDLIIMMDVYEHIAVSERMLLHEAISDLRADDGMIVLSFPTPQHLVWLTHNRPDQIQPVDEHITAETILSLAHDTKTSMLLYKEVDVWHRGDYAHAVLGTRNGWLPIISTSSSPGLRNTFARWFFTLRRASLIPKRRRRLALVRERLGINVYPG